MHQKCEGSCGLWVLNEHEYYEQLPKLEVLIVVGPKKQDFCKEMTRFHGFHLIFLNGGAWGLKS